MYIYKDETLKKEKLKQSKNTELKIFFHIKLEQLLVPH